MYELRPRRPWWRRKRAWATAAYLLLLPAAYVLCLFLTGVLSGLLWIESATVRAVYSPVVPIRGTAAGDVAEWLHGRGMYAGLWLLFEVGEPWLTLFQLCAPPSVVGLAGWAVYRRVRKQRPAATQNDPPSPGR